METSDTQNMMERADDSHAPKYKYSRLLAMIADTEKHAKMIVHADNAVNTIQYELYAATSSINGARDAPVHPAKPMSEMDRFL